MARTTMHGPRDDDAHRSPRRGDRRVARATHAIRRHAGMLVALLLIGAGVGCRAERGEDVRREAEEARRGAPAADPVPLAIEAIGHHAEEAYDTAWASDWARARAAVDSLGASVRDLDTVSGRADRGGDIRETLAALDRGVTVRDRETTLRQANRLTALGAELARSFAPRIPADVTLLDYHGRELQLGAEAGDVARLRQTALAMARTWTVLRPQVAAHGGMAEAARFDDLVARVGNAQSAADYARLAIPVLDEVDNLERVFVR